MSRIAIALLVSVVASGQTQPATLVSIIVCVPGGATGVQCYPMTVTGGMLVVNNGQAILTLSPGPAGPQGIPGASGAAGAPGAQGIAGPIGHQGIAGPTGLQGNTGPAGAALPPQQLGLSGVVDGKNNLFSLPNVTVKALMLFRNGILLAPGTDYSRIGTQIVFSASSVPEAGAILIGWVW